MSDLHDEIVKALRQTPINAKDIIETMARCKSPFELERIAARGGHRRCRRERIARRRPARSERIRACRHRRVPHAIPRRRR